MAKKRVYEVVNNNPHNTGLRVGNETLKFNRDNFMYVHDEDKGKEIQNLYDGTDAIVNETEIYVGNEPGHRYTFSGVDTSHFKVWVVRNGKLSRVTKATAKARGYPVISEAKRRPEVRR